MSLSKQRKYAADVEADFTGRPQPYGTYDQDAEDRASTEQGDGTEASGYVTPELGPFRCDNCVHYSVEQKSLGTFGGTDANSASLGSGGVTEANASCDHPVVIRDPEVRGEVDAAGCCNYFKSRQSSVNSEQLGEA